MSTPVNCMIGQVCKFFFSLGFEASVLLFPQGILKNFSILCIIVLYTSSPHSRRRTMKGFFMSGIINTIVSLLVAVFVTGGVSNIAQETPREAVNEFFTGLTEGNSQTYELYMDNSYINLIANSGMSDEDA